LIVPAARVIWVSPAAGFDWALRSAAQVNSAAEASAFSGPENDCAIARNLAPAKNWQWMFYEILLIPLSPDRLCEQIA
jgi:hypothetical protein